jgi:hypothetical protein
MSVARRRRGRSTSGARRRRGGQNRGCRKAGLLTSAAEMPPQIDDAVEAATKRGRTNGALAIMLDQRKARAALASERENAARELADIKTERTVFSSRLLRPNFPPAKADFPTAWVPSDRTCAWARSKGMPTTSRSVLVAGRSDAAGCPISSLSSAWEVLHDSIFPVRHHFRGTTGLAAHSSSGEGHPGRCQQSIRACRTFDLTFNGRLI